MPKRYAQIVGIAGLCCAFFLGGCDLSSDLLSVLDALDNLTGADNATDNTSIDNETSGQKATNCTLALQTQGEGTAWADPSGGVYPRDSVITLHAQPAAGWRFRTWTTSEKNVEVWFQLIWNPAVVVMNRDKTIVAVFEPDSLSITPTPQPEITPTPTATPTPTPTPTPPAPQVAAPVITLLDGTIPDNSTVFSHSADFRISCATAGAAIYYTTNGTDPVSGGTLYDPLDNSTHWVGHTTWVKAVARLAGMADSPVTAANFIISPDTPLVDNISITSPLVAGGPNAITISCDAIDFDGTVTGIYTSLVNLGGPSTVSLANTGGHHWEWTGTVSPYSGGTLAISLTATGSDGESGWGSDNVTVIQPGTVKWSFATGGAVSSSPAIAPDGTIYFGSQDKHVYALNPDGSLRWSFLMDNGTNASPSIAADGTIYIGSDDGNLYALTPAGVMKWAYPTDNRVTTTPAIAADGTLYFGSDNGTICALNPDGTHKWSASTGNAVRSSPVVGHDGTIFFGSGYNIYAVNANGSSRWSYPTGCTVDATASIGLDGTVYIGTDNGTLCALEPDNGTLKWAVTADDRIVGSCGIADNGTLYFGCLDGWVRAVDTLGASQWDFSTGNAVYSSPAVSAQGTVHIGSDDAKLYALNPDNGSEVWQYAASAGISGSPAIGTDGTVYFGSVNGTFYALYGAAPLASSSPWPMFHHDLQHTGRANAYNPPPVVTPPATLGPLPLSLNLFSIDCEATDNGSVVDVILDLSSIGGSAPYHMTYNSGSGRWEWSDNFQPLNLPGLVTTIRFIAIDDQGGVTVSPVQISLALF